MSSNNKITVLCNAMLGCAPTPTELRRLADRRISITLLDIRSAGVQAFLFCFLFKYDIASRENNFNHVGVSLYRELITKHIRQLFLLATGRDNLRRWHNEAKHLWHFRKLRRKNMETFLICFVFQFRVDLSKAWIINFHCRMLLMSRIIKAWTSTIFSEIN